MLKMLSLLLNLFLFCISYSAERILENKKTIIVLREGRGGACVYFHKRKPPSQKIISYKR